jgi:hypothetical protein
MHEGLSAVLRVTELLKPTVRGAPQALAVVDVKLQLLVRAGEPFA